MIQELPMQRRAGLSNHRPHAKLLLGPFFPSQFLIPFIMVFILLLFLFFLLLHNRLSSYFHCSLLRLPLFFFFLSSSPSLSPHPISLPPTRLLLVLFFIAH